MSVKEYVPEDEDEADCTRKWVCLLALLARGNADKEEKQWVWLNCSLGFEDFLRKPTLGTKLQWTEWKDSGSHNVGEVATAPTILKWNSVC